MNWSDVTADFTNQNSYTLKQRLTRLMRLNPDFKNLDKDNINLVFKLLKKYQDKLRSGLKPSRSTIREDKYYLYEHRIKLGLSDEDLRQLGHLLESFKDYK